MRAWPPAGLMLLGLALLSSALPALDTTVLPDPKLQARSERHV